MARLLPVCLVVLLACSGDDAPDPTEPATCADAPGWDEAQSYVRTWCLPCHSETIPVEDRQGAPPGVDFDTYDQVITWLDRIEARATGDDPDMPPVVGATPDALDRFSQWLSCGADGAAAAPGACDELVLAEAPAILRTEADVEALCASGNRVEGSLDTSVDVPCLCEVDGDLTVDGATVPLLVRVGGDLNLSGGAPGLPELDEVGGSIRTDNTVTVVALPHLRHVGGSVSLLQGDQVTQVDLSGLLTVDGTMDVQGLLGLATLDLSRLRVVGGPLRLIGLPSLHTIEGLTAVESIGRGPTREGEDGGGIELVGLGQLVGLDAFRLLVDLGGPVVIEGNAQLLDVDGFTTLPQLDHAVRVVDNPRLQALEGFDLLTSVDQLEIRDNEDLQNVFGFVNLVDGGAVSVSGSPALRSLDGLADLETADLLSLQGLAVLDIPWFTSLHTVSGDLVLQDLDSVTVISGLSSLTTVTGTLQVQNAPVLTALPGGPLTDAGGVHLEALPALGDAPLLSGLTGVTGDVVLQSTGLAHLDDLAELRHVGGDLVVVYNPDLPSSAVDALLGVVQVDGTTTTTDNGP